MVICVYIWLWRLTHGEDTPLMNRHMKPEIEVFFMMSSLECLYVSSSRLKELAHFGADIDEFVPAEVAKQLREKLGPR